MPYYLKQITRSNQPIIISLTEAEVIVGTNNVQLRRYPQISEQHAKFYKIEDRIYIRDLSSRYGTYVNDVRIGSGIKPLTRIDIIGFGVNSKSAENGFVCILVREPFEEGYNTRNQPVVAIKKEPPEIIDLSDDDDTHVMPKILLDSVKTVNPTCLDFKTSDVQENASPLSNRSVEILIEESWEHAKNVNVAPSTSRGRTSVQKSYPRTKKCWVPLIRCDSESFLWPPDVKNPFLLESEDEDIVSVCKKRPKRISSDSSVESSEEESPRSFLKKPENKQNQFNNNVDVSKSSSREQTDNWKNILSRRKKRARKISSDSSDESSVESIDSIYHKSKKSFSNQSKTKNTPSSGFVTLPELSSSDISVKKTDKNVSSNKSNPLNSFKIPKLPALNSAVQSSSRNVRIHSLNDSRMDTAKRSSYKRYPIKNQETEVGKQLFQIPSNTVTNTRMMKSLATMKSHPQEDICHEPYNDNDTYSIADEVIDVSDGDDYFDIDMAQNFIPIKTEPEDAEDPEYYDIFKEIFEGDDESEGLTSNSICKNSALENQEIESIETIQQFVNCTTQKNSVESESGRNEELNSKLTNSESEMSPEEDFLPSVKNFFRNSKYGDKKNPKSSGKTLLTDPKPMTYRPRKMRGRDEGYVERQKPVDQYQKRKRGRPKKEEQLQSETTNLNSSVTITKIPKKSEERPILLSNFILKTSRKDKDTSGTGLSGAKNVKSAKKSLSNPKSIQTCSSFDEVRDGENSEKQITVDPFAKRKKGRPKKCSEFEPVVYNPDLQNQLSERPHKCKEKMSVNDCHKSKSLPSSTGTKESRKNYISSVKIRPDKFSSRMGFLTNGEEAKPVRRDKISGKSKKYKGVSNGEKNNAPQIELANKVRTDEKNVVSGNIPPICRIEDKHPEQKTAIFSHTLQNKNSEVSVFQKISHPSTDVSSTRSLHVKDLKGSRFENIPHSSTDASRTPILRFKNSEESMFHNPPHFSANASNRISTPREDIQVPLEISFNSMVKSLLKLKTIWLQEQRTISYPPADVIQGVETLPLSFTSYESYAASFYSLLKLEIWQYMFEASKEVLPNKRMVKRFSFRVLSFINKLDYMELKCESVVSDKCYFEPREGMMTVLEMKMNSHQSYPLFGFIFKHKISPVNLNLLHPCWKKTSHEYLNNAKHWIFHAWIKQKELLLEPDILMKGNGICYLRNKLRLVDALRCFKDSPLMTDIIEPRLSTFALTYTKSSSNREYTSRQFEVIQAVCSEIYKPYLECKITLIHGPPGTGKTHIIIGILETLFYASKYNSNLKVLVTAPSNVAVDEIGCRLIELNERYGWRDYTVKFVRVGVEKQVHSKMLPYFIDRKAAELHKKTVRSSKHKERELQALRLEISNLEKEPDSLNKKKKLNSLNERCKFIEDNFSLKKVHYLTEIKYKCDILKESHIVLTTLSSCNLSVLCKTFLPTSKSDLNFSCCIVDESTQCTELEILQPLALGISKLILVGDEKQLPAAHSEYTDKYRFDRSMLERFCQYFKSSNQPSPVVSLTEQFRMHPSICQFPSTYVYNKKLDTHPETILMYKEFPLKPYIILDISQSSDSSSETIKDCEVLIYNICKFLAKVVDSSSSIGVLVPHESQRFLCTKFLHSHSYFSDVEVNTVNGFQGKEKDIIILCAIDPKFHAAAESFITCKRKFNVALTRARKCLIICLDSRTLLEHRHWKALIYEGVERKICFTVTSPKDVSSVLHYAKK